MSNVVAMREEQNRPEGHPVALVRHGVMIALVRTLAMFERDQLEDLSSRVLPPAWEDLAVELGFEERLFGDLAKVVLKGGRGLVLGICSDLQMAKTVLASASEYPRPVRFLAERMVAAAGLVDRFADMDGDAQEAPSMDGQQVALARVRRLVRLALKDPVAALAISQDPRLESWGWLQRFARAVASTDASDPAQFFSPQLRQTAEQWLGDPNAAKEFLDSFASDEDRETIPSFLITMAQVFSIGEVALADLDDAMLHLELDEF